MRPMFPYYGSKWNIARYYPAPVHETVIEPFAGAAGYASFYDVRKAILIDKDPIIAGIWRYLTRVSASEIMSLPELPCVEDSVDDQNIAQEAKWLIGFWLNRGSASPKKSRTAYSARIDRAQLNWGQRAKERIASQLSFISEWIVIEGDYREAPATKGTWFVDPPYGHKGKYYRVPFKGFSELGRWCQTRSGQTIVCEALGAEWLPFQKLGDFKSSTGRSHEVIFTAAAE